MKKCLIITILIALFSVSLDCFAANTVAVEGDASFDTLKNEYNKGIQSINISGQGTVTLYGYSSCSSNGCNYNYANTTSDFKEILKKSIKCTGGEKYIIYQTTGGADGYKTSNSANYTGEAYWSEDFAITCTNTSSSSTITLENTANTITNNNNNNGTQYQSSTTTQNEKQGVGTYYIVLAIISIITYIVMVVIKKQNLFKSI